MKLGKANYLKEREEGKDWKIKVMSHEKMRKFEMAYWDLKAIYAETLTLKFMGDDPVVNIYSGNTLLIFTLLKEAIELLDDPTKANYLCIQGKDKEVQSGRNQYDFVLIGTPDCIS